VKCRLLVSTIMAALLSAVAPLQAHAATQPPCCDQLWLTTSAPVRVFNYHPNGDTRFIWTGTAKVKNVSKTRATGVHVNTFHIGLLAGDVVGQARLNGVPKGVPGAKSIYIGIIDPGKTATVTWSFIAPPSATVIASDFEAEAGIGLKNGPSVGATVYLQPYR
jgi:hypothetical protein